MHHRDRPTWTLPPLPVSPVGTEDLVSDVNQVVYGPGLMEVIHGFFSRGPTLRVGALSTLHDRLPAPPLPRRLDVAAPGDATEVDSRPSMGHGSAFAS